MSELVTVYPSKPPVAGGYSNPGAILYRGVYFSVTLRSSSESETDNSGDEVFVIGTMATAKRMMDDIVNAHEMGMIVLSGEVLWRDPDDQRPASEPRKGAVAPETGTPLPTQRPTQNEGQKPTGTKYKDRPVGTTENGKAIYSFKLAQVRLEANPNGSRYLALYPLISGGPGKYPAVRVNDHKSQTIDWGIISNVTGVNWGDAAVSTMYAANGIDCLYTLSDKQTQQGNPYKDFYQLAEATEEAAEEMPF